MQPPSSTFQICIHSTYKLFIRRSNTFLTMTCF
uniref:Uncharacterized protein n=1 Tax=Anguilla anguilla TaxID=7936 RepID=A0A0E9USI2_ANGAN